MEGNKKKISRVITKPKKLNKRTKRTLERKNMKIKLLEEYLNHKTNSMLVSESSGNGRAISRIIKSIKAALILGSIASFLWTIKGPEDLPGSGLDKSPWIKDKHAEYKDKEKEEKEKKAGNEELAYIPILRRELGEITAYVPEDPRQTDSDPENASCGKYDHLIKKGVNIIAVSRDIFFDEEAKRMLKRGKPLCGLPAVIRLKNGEEVKGIIVDTMNPRFTKKADLGISVRQYGGSLEKANRAAREFGKKEAKEIIVFLPVSKKALLEGMMSERIKERLKWTLESYLRSYLSRKESPSKKGEVNVKGRHAQSS